jgi:hypothetical protein
VEHNLVKIHKYTLEEIEEAIKNQLVDTHSNYKYMMDFVFPLLRQRRLCQTYPGIVGRIYATVQEAIILGLAKLLDTTRKPLIIHFKKLLIAAQRIPPEQIKNKSQWDKYLTESKTFLSELPGLMREIAFLRNKSVAHLIPALPNPHEIKTWKYWRTILERMENIFNLYQGAVRDTHTTQFWTVNLRFEPKSFLEWCRLDDFAQHKEWDLERKRRRINQRKASTID